MTLVSSCFVIIASIQPLKEKANPTLELKAHGTLQEESKTSKTARN